MANNTGPSGAIIRQATVITFLNNRMRPIRGVLGLVIPLISSVLNWTTNAIVTTLLHRFHEPGPAQFR